MIFPRAWFFFICGYKFPFFELDIQILIIFADDIHVEKMIIEGSVLILASKTENAIQSENVAVVRLHVVGVDQLVMRKVINHFTTVTNVEVQR